MFIMLPKKITYIFILVLADILVVSCISKSSLSFVIDDTGSMYDEINQVRRGANAIMDIVLNKKSSQIENIILVTVNDPGVQLLQNTRSREELLSALNSIETYGGDDCPEMSMTGVQRALDESLPGSYIYVFTDASAKDYKCAEQVIDTCQKKQSKVVFVLTGHCGSIRSRDFTVYYDVALACSGQVFTVKKDQIKIVLKYVEETVAGEVSIVTSKLVPPNEWTQIPFTLDDKAEYAIVTTAGNYVYLDISGPSERFEKIIWTPNLKVVKIVNPIPGYYICTVRGSSTTSVEVVERTDFTFQHGFSETEPKSLNDTSKQPIAGIKSHLCVFVDDPEHTVRVHTAQILDIDENLIQELPLKDTSRDFYITDMFLPPNTLFKVAINCFGVNGKPIRRIAKTPVEPQKPKIIPIINKPVMVTISEGSGVDIGYNSTIQLTCQVTAYPKPNIIWKDSKGNVIPSQSYAVELPYKYISYLKVYSVIFAEKYFCEADNSETKATTEIDVTVQSPFTVLNHPEDITNVMYNQDVTLQCKIKSTLPMNIKWIYKENEINNSEKYIISSDGIEIKINNIDLNNDGMYTCVAQLDADNAVRTSYTTSVVIQDLAAPEIEKNTNVLTVNESMPAYLRCKILSGTPTPEISWYFKGQESMTFETIPEITDTLQLLQANLLNSGLYKCTAKNVIGFDEYTTELIVQVFPRPIDMEINYEAVIGDVVLQIPCSVVGNPKPTIIWKINDTVILEKDNKYSIEDDTLVIDNPTIGDNSNKYTCEANNILGTFKRNFIVSVSPFINDVENSENVYMKVGESKEIKCPIPHSENDLVRWFVNGEYNLTGSVIHLYNATEMNDGNYTCRVSNKLGARTTTLVLDVGYPPQFEYSPINVYYWNGKFDMIDNCRLSIHKPEADIEWSYNGKVIKGANVEEISISNWGNYTCRISNVHGNLSRSIIVTSKGCLINTDANSPLLLTKSFTWPTLEHTELFLTLKHQDKLLLSCHSQQNKPNSFRKFLDKNNIEATCDHEDKFVVNNEVYKFSELECIKKVMPVLKRTGERCFNENTEIIQVGFNVNKFINVYDVCYDNKENVALYTKVNITDISEFTQYDEPDTKWYNFHALQDNKFENAYNCGTKTECCYAKTQLVNVREVSYGPIKTATYIENLNAIPYWRCKNENTWENLEEQIKTNVESGMELTVWSGISNFNKESNHTVPRFLWKVVKFLETNETVAFIHVNNPTPNQAIDRLCENICDMVDFIQPPGWPTYCCRLNDFSKVSNIPIDVFM